MDAGSNQVSVQRALPGGSLRLSEVVSRQLFVTNAHNGTGLGTVSAFAGSPAGSLTPIGASPYADQQTAPCWMVISPDGQHLFAVNTRSGTMGVGHARVVQRRSWSQALTRSASPRISRLGEECRLVSQSSRSDRLPRITVSAYE